MGFATTLDAIEDGLTGALAAGRWEAVSPELDSIASVCVRALAAGDDAGIERLSAIAATAFRRVIVDHDLDEAADATWTAAQLRGVNRLLAVALRSRAAFTTGQAAELEGDATAKIRVLLAAHPKGLSNGRLVELTGLSAEHVSRTLALLTANGEVRFRRVGRERINFAVRKRAALAASQLDAITAMTNHFDSKFDNLRDNLAETVSNKAAEAVTNSLEAKFNTLDWNAADLPLHRNWVGQKPVGRTALYAVK